MAETEGRDGFNYKNTPNIKTCTMCQGRGDLRILTRGVINILKHGLTRTIICPICNNLGLAVEKKNNKL